MSQGMGTTIKQVNKLKIKLGADGLYRVYPTKNELRFTNVGEFGSRQEAIDFALFYDHRKTNL